MFLRMGYADRTRFCGDHCATNVLAYVSQIIFYTALDLIVHPIYVLLAPFFLIVSLFSKEIAW